jgi:peptidyl-prolyl cis-trans isomerase D
MLQKLRDQTQGTGFKILVGAIIVVLTLFGFGATNLFLGGDPEVAQVGDFEITQGLLEAESERERRRLLAQMGPEFDPSTIDRLQLQQYALQQLINRQVLYQTSSELGVRAAPEQVNQELISSPAYQIDGQFNEPVYRQQVQALGFTPVGFLEEFTSAFSSEQVRNGISDSVVLPDWELGEIVRVVSQQRDLAYLPLTVDNFRARVEVSDDEVTLRYNEDQTAYMTELAVDAAYVRLGVEDLLEDVNIEITEDELLALYDDERAAALADEQRDSSHILVQINDDRSEAQALELITEVQTRLREGESFEKLAGELSEDPGSADSGGALGPVGKGIFDPAFEEALWSLSAPGEVTPPVRTDFGYHLIRLHEIVLPEYASFESEREGLELRLRQLQAEDLFADRALELERAAYDERYTLEGTAAALGLQVVSAAQISRGAPGEDALVAKPVVLDALFGSEVLEGSNSDPIALSDTEVLIVRVDKQYPPEAIPLDDVRDQIKQDIEREKALVEIEAAKSAGMQSLQAGESVTEIARSVNSQWQTFTLAPRGGDGREIPDAVRSVAFDLPRPTAGAKSVGVAELPDGAALVTVTRVVQGDLNTTTDTDVAELRRISQVRAGRFDFQSFFQAAQENLGVSQPGS